MASGKNSPRVAFYVHDRETTEMEKSWKCTLCGYSLKDKEPPEECPACKEKCTFVDNVDYTQTIGDKRPDERI